VDPARVREVRRRREDPERRQRDRRRQREPDPGRDAAEHSSPPRADRDPELAARRSGQCLGQCDEVGEGRLIEPVPLLDVFAAEIADVRDRPAERGQAEAERRAQDLEDGSAIRRRAGIWRRDGIRRRDGIGCRAGRQG
jgi:hypothetical protein